MSEPVVASPEAEAPVLLGAPHATPPAHVLDALGVDRADGLSTAEAAERLAADGPNELASPKPPSLLVRFVAQFKNLMILILVAAAVVSASLGHYTDAVIVAGVLILNAVLGTIQEARAERSVRALKGLLPTTATVRRDGRLVEVAAAELVVGDVVAVEAGDRVPADARVLVAAQLATDESSLTGETSAVSKAADDVVDADAAVADRTTMAWLNTTVVRGRGELVVTGTGMDTRIGQVAKMLAEAEPRPTPLQRQIDGLAKRLALVAGGAVVAVFAVALARGDSWGDAAMDAIALAIAAIPEGLPAVVTITLGLGTAAMARQRAIVKRLTSVETLGSTQIICTDKTGTLTRNQMTARALVVGGTRHEVSGDGYGAQGEVTPPVALRGEALDAMVLCNDADIRDDELVGDPTEGAVLGMAAKAGADLTEVRTRRPRLAEAPFDSATKVMATVHAADGGGSFVAVKGAPDVVLGRCAAVVAGDAVVAMDEAQRAAVAAQISELASEGLRTIAVASRHVDTDPGAVSDAAELIDDLTLEAVIGIVDPPRDGVADAIALAGQAGIRVMMVTGDHPDTAAAIAEQIGITGDVLTGADLDRMDDAELSDRVRDLGVCARVAPEHKVRLVTALQGHGLTTAMTGDGVNDAAALKRADIGVAMGIAGTEVTKEAGDLVLADDDFSTIVTAVQRGRNIYDNIVSFVRFQVATNIGAIIVILGARLIGLPAPLTPIQVLWVNLIMDGPPALALGADPGRPGAMGRPPRDPSTPLLHGSRLRRLLLTGTVMAIGTLGLFWWGLESGHPDGQTFASTMAFTTFVLFQFVNAVNARLEDSTVFSRHTLTNTSLWVALSVVAVLQVVAVQTPVIGGFVNVVPLDWGHWAIAAATALSLLVVEEVRKLIARIRRGPDAPVPDTP